MQHLYRFLSNLLMQKIILQKQLCILLFPLNIGPYVFSSITVSLDIIFKKLQNFHRMTESKILSCSLNCWTYKLLPIFHYYKYNLTCIFCKMTFLYCDAVCTGCVVCIPSSLGQIPHSWNHQAKGSEHFEVLKTYCHIASPKSSSNQYI